jgi:hypothetical protein
MSGQADQSPPIVAQARPSLENDVNRTSSEPDAPHTFALYPPWFKAIKVLEGLSYIAVIAGIAFFFLQHQHELERGKAAATLGYVNLFNSDKLSEARKLLLQSWYEHSAKLAVIRSLGPANTHSMDDYVNMIIDKRAKEGRDRDLQPALFSLVDFYEQVLLCVEKDICERQTTLSYFGDYANPFLCLYSGWISRNRRLLSAPDYGKRLETFALSIRRC